MPSSSSAHLLAAAPVHDLEHGSPRPRAKYLAGVHAPRPRSVAGDTTPGDVAEAYEVPPVEPGALLYSSGHFRAYPRGAEMIGSFRTAEEAQAALRAWGEAGEVIVGFLVWLGGLGGG